jgi:hypothetical protein
MTDIFKFWSVVGPNERIHPSDRAILDACAHGFDLKCLPVPYYGKLKVAPIVLLYLNPGLTKRDVSDAKTTAGQEFYWRQRRGNEPLRDQTEEAKKSWWVSVTKAFDLDLEVLRFNLAVLEICPYHSKGFADAPLLAALPSCRTAIEWAQNTLFPEALKGNRVVVCLRSHRYWGLQPGREYGGSLFAPRTSRSGHMLKSGGNIILREKVRTAVHRVLRKAA